MSLTQTYVMPTFFQHKAQRRVQTKNTAASHQKNGSLKNIICLTIPYHSQNIELRTFIP